jgi:hypothetical protein
MDFYGNALAQGLYQMNFPFNFKSSQEWIKLFNDNRYKQSDTKFIGLLDQGLHTFFQLLFICDAI